MLWRSGVCNGGLCSVLSGILFAILLAMIVFASCWSVYSLASC